MSDNAVVVSEALSRDDGRAPMRDVITAIQENLVDYPEVIGVDAAILLDALTTWAWDYKHSSEVMLNVRASSRALRDG